MDHVRVILNNPKNTSEKMIEDILLGTSHKMVGSSVEHYRVFNIPSSSEHETDTEKSNVIQLIDESSTEDDTRLSSLHHDADLSQDDNHVSGIKSVKGAHSIIWAYFSKILIIL
jgi:hypothetical protein